MAQFFTRSELGPWLENRLQEALARIDEFDREQVKFSPDAVAAEVAAAYAVDSVGLDWERLRASEPREVKLQGRQFGNTYSTDGHSVSIFIPLLGPAEVLRKRASHSWLGGYPEVEQVGTELHVVG